MGRWNCRRPGPKDGGGELGPQDWAPDPRAEKEAPEESRGQRPKPRCPRVQTCPGALRALCLSIRSQALRSGGEDWLFLFLLGVSMAALSFGLDVVTSKFQQANLWVYGALAGSPSLQYFSWVLYHAVLVMVAAASAKYLSPPAAGSGIPELKVALRGVVLGEFFTFRTFVAKMVGVGCTLAAGSTLFLGKVGPFVHMATILALLLGRVMVRFTGSAENPGRKYELMVAGVAVGVACCFVAPVGGVLFGVEATGTHFAVRDYWRGFFAATCAALTFRLLALLSNTRETVAVLFQTTWRVEFPYDLPELLSYAILGALSGAVCCLFLFCHRSLFTVLQQQPRVKRLVGNNRVFHAGFVALLLASVTFPHGSGQYIGSKLSMKELLQTFFSNGSWALEGPSGGANTTGAPFLGPASNSGWPQGAHLDLSSLEMVSFFLLAKFFMVLLASSMVIPAGYFLPVFVYGAALGRLYGEVMAKIFPDGIVSEGIRMRITPAGYALAGAASFSGAVTQTLSTALLTFELTGQMTHILPVLVAVLVANGISQSCQPSFFEGIILAKRLPFLPKLSGGKSRGHDLRAEDFMVTDLKSLSRESRFKDVRGLLGATRLRQFPLVDSPESGVLLGAIQRKDLARLLSDQLSPERRFQYLLSRSEEGPQRPPEEGGSGGRNGGRSELEPPADGTSVDDETPKSVPGSAGVSPSPQKKHLEYCSLVEEWECRQLQETLRLEDVPLDPAPYRLLPKETLYQCYDLFNLLSLRTAYVTHAGRLVGVVGLKELKMAVERCVRGTAPNSRPTRDPIVHGRKVSEEAKLIR